MKILIYSETAAAFAKRNELKAQGHHAVIRNPQFFNVSQFDKTGELVIADDLTILQAYEDVGIAVERLTQQVTDEPPVEEIAEAAAETIEPATEPVEEKPRRGRR